MEKTCQLAVGVCCCLKTCNSVVNMLLMWLVHGPSLMIKSITGILLYAKVSPIIMYYEVCCCLYVKQLVYKHLNRSVHIGPSKSRCL